MSDIAGEELATRENSVPYQDTSPSPLPRTQLPRLPAPVLPHQISQVSSTRSIPPSSSSLTSPSNLSSLRPTWPGHRSPPSSTLRSHSHSTTGNQSQPRLPQPSAENSSHADTPTVPPPPLTERQRSANGPQPQPRTRSQKLPTRAITPQRKQHRYCETCGIVKPPRTHHCRTCGMVRRRFVCLVEGGQGADGGYCSVF